MDQFIIGTILGIVLGYFLNKLIAIVERIKKDM
jgi:uncharacterized membrane protein (Fun14 family)